MLVLRKSNLCKTGSACVCDCFQRKLVVTNQAGFSSNVFMETIWLLWPSLVMLVMSHYNFVIQLSEPIQPHCWVCLQFLVLSFLFLPIQSLSPLQIHHLQLGFISLISLVFFDRFLIQMSPCSHTPFSISILHCSSRNKTNRKERCSSMCEHW